MSVCTEMLKVFLLNIVLVKFYKNLRTHYNYWLKSDRVIRRLLEALHASLRASRSELAKYLLGAKNIWNKICREDSLIIAQYTLFLSLTFPWINKRYFFAVCRH